MDGRRTQIPSATMIRHSFCLIRHWYCTELLPRSSKSLLVLTFLWARDKTERRTHLQLTNLREDTNKT